MIYNDDPFLRNKPFTNIQMKSNFVNNATHLLNDTNKIAHQVSHATYK